MANHTDSQGDIVRMGDYVIISSLLNDKISRLVKIEPTGFAYLKKDKIDLKTIVGDSVNSIYSLDRANHSLNKTEMSNKELMELFDLEPFGDINFSDETKDNRFINDDGTSQRLERNDIEALKRDGVGGDEIIKSLIENSTSFKDKNPFSQEKYLKKKRSKYSNLIRVQKPTVSLLADYYYSAGPMKISNLRIDTLSQMLTMCNVRSSGNYIVVDTNLGLLTAAVIDRLVGNGSLLAQGYEPGHCIQVYLDDGPITSWRHCVEALNLSPELLQSCLLSLSMRRLIELKKGDHNKKSNLIKDSETQVKQEVETQPDPISTPKRQKLDEKAFRRESRKKEEEKAISILSEENIDGILIVTTNYDPSDILNALYPFLGPSNQYAVFSLSLDNLLTCYQLLRGTSMNSKISETWLRYYQVLPSRTRPDINMSGSGGYLLSGTKVIPGV